MGHEIERKFLVQGDAWRGGACTLYRQGYLSTNQARTVRVRVAGEKAYLTVKGLNRGVTRREFEYAIPLPDAMEMLDELCTRPLIEKRRYRVTHAGFDWEIDEFLGDNTGLIVAELELAHEDQAFDAPPWLGPEVTSDPRYFNANLVEHPFSTW